MRKIILLFTLAVLFSTCSKNANDPDRCRWEYFSANLRSDMDYAMIINAFGAPAADIGSGIHIYVYKLCDNTEIWIGYADHIMYARHLDNNHQLLHTLI